MYPLPMSTMAGRVWEGDVPPTHEHDGWESVGGGCTPYHEFGVADPSPGRERHDGQVSGPILLRFWVKGLAMRD